MRERLPTPFGCVEEERQIEREREKVLRHLLFHLAKFSFYLHDPKVHPNKLECRQSPITGGGAMYPGGLTTPHALMKKGRSCLAAFAPSTRRCN